MEPLIAIIAVGALMFLALWIAMVVENEREMRRLRKLGRVVLPVFPCGYVDVTRPKPMRPPWLARPTEERKER